MNYSQANSIRSLTTWLDNCPFKSTLLFYNTILCYKITQT